MTDPLGLAPQGLPTRDRTNLREDLRRIAGVMAERSVELLLVGDPLHLSGRVQRDVRLRAGFGDRLHAKTRMPVQYWDERLTSTTAEERLRELGQPVQRGDGRWTAWLQSCCWRITWNPPGARNAIDLRLFVLMPGLLAGGRRIFVHFAGPAVRGISAARPIVDIPKGAGDDYDCAGPA